MKTMSDDQRQGDLVIESLPHISFVKSATYRWVRVMIRTQTLQRNV